MFAPALRVSWIEKGTEAAPIDTFCVLVTRPAVVVVNVACAPVARPAAAVTVTFTVFLAVFFSIFQVAFVAVIVVCFPVI